MTIDPTTEIKRIRHELGVVDGLDVARIFARIRKFESSTDRSIVRRNPRRITDNKPMRGSGEESGVEMESLPSPPRDR